MPSSCDICGRDGALPCSTSACSDANLCLVCRGATCVYCHRDAVGYDHYGEAACATHLKPQPEPAKNQRACAWCYGLMEPAVDDLDDELCTACRWDWSAEDQAAEGIAEWEQNQPCWEEGAY